MKISFKDLRVKLYKTQDDMKRETAWENACNLFNFSRDMQR